jgi:hypothetical protein
MGSEALEIAAAAFERFTIRAAAGAIRLTSSCVQSHATVPGARI